jgi:hypothetical protein
MLVFFRRHPRALFEKDKLLFAFLLAASVQAAAGRVAAGLIRFMVTGATPAPAAPRCFPTPLSIHTVSSVAARC